MKQMIGVAMAWLEPHMRRIIATRALPPYRNVSLGYAQLGEQAGVIGAAALLLTSTAREHSFNYENNTRNEHEHD